MAAWISGLVKLTTSVLLITAVALAVGWFSVLGPVKRADVAVFDAVVPLLQDIPFLVSVSEVVTRMGAVPVNYGMVMALAAFVTVQTRLAARGLALIGIFECGHMIQWLSIELIDGSVPTEHLIGTGGPYFSGGVLRVMLICGFIFRLARPDMEMRERLKLATVAGVIEGITRLVLGRHWPIDIVAALPIGWALIVVHDRLDQTLNFVKVGPGQRSVQPVPVVPARPKGSVPSLAGGTRP